MTKRDPLAEYNAKRNFARTTEPAGKASSSVGNIFMVQKHDATRLHWDLRLEIDGVLKSWAVTKGPSPDPEIKRLAVRTEDHPLSYATFEGVIPKGEYGGGTVMLWDHGTWAPIAGKSAKDLNEGHLHFILDGERMRGEWLLIRLKRRVKEKSENWLLRKLQDDFAETGDALIERALTSVETGRSMAEIAFGKGQTDCELADRAKAVAVPEKDKKKRARSKVRVDLPSYRQPQLATLVDHVPTGNDWMHEIKFDGYRALVAVAGDNIRIWTRNGKDWTDKFAPLARHIRALSLPRCLIDGEIVAYDSKGNPDFSALQAVLKRGSGAQSEKDMLAYHAFDLLDLRDTDLTPLANVERKERLEALLTNAAPPIHVADHVIGSGEKLYEAICAAHQEGIISKKIDGPYQHRRTKAWVKVKCTRRQEFVIVGWSESSARGRPFASLLLAQHEGGKLRYRGKVGTGFDSETMADISAQLRRIERKTPPVEVSKSAARNAHWVTPKLVAEIAFAELTADKRVRHGSFLGLREDKPARDVRPETEAPVPGTGSVVKISSRNRIVFPESGQTKGQLANYYLSVAGLMLPFIGQRPVSLVRCPQGRAKKCFFQKHDSGSLGDHVHSIPIAEKDGRTEDYLYLDDATGILECVQMGTIEFHGWGARTMDVEAPERMVFDLDPDEGLDFAVVKRAAHDLRQQLADLGLVSFAMLTGGKGVHLVVPLIPDHSWETHKDFSRRFAEALSFAQPDRFTASMSKGKRKGRIFIDWLRNQRGSTAILPYSARARVGAPVAVPLPWVELDALIDARFYSVDNAPVLLKRAKGKALAGWGFAEQRLPSI